MRGQAEHHSRGEQESVTVQDQRNALAILRAQGTASPALSCWQVLQCPEDGLVVPDKGLSHCRMQGGEGLGLTAAGL